MRNFRTNPFRSNSFENLKDSTKIPVDSWIQSSNDISKTSLSDLEYCEIITNSIQAVQSDKELNLNFSSKVEVYKGISNVMESAQRDPSKTSPIVTSNGILDSSSSLQIKKEKSTGALSVPKSVLNTFYTMEEMTLRSNGFEDFRIPIGTASGYNHSLSDVLETIETFETNELDNNQNFSSKLSGNHFNSGRVQEIEVSTQEYLLESEQNIIDIENPQMDFLFTDVTSQENDNAFDFSTHFHTIDPYNTIENINESNSLNNMETIPQLLLIFTKYQRSSLLSQKELYFQSFIETSLQDGSKIDSFSTFHSEICLMLSNQFIHSLGQFIIEEKYEQLKKLVHILIVIHKFNWDGKHHYSENFPKSIVLLIEKLHKLNKKHKISNNSINPNDNNNNSNNPNNSNNTNNRFAFITEEIVDKFEELGIKNLDNLNLSTSKSKLSFISLRDSLSILFLDILDNINELVKTKQDTDFPFYIEAAILISSGVFYSMTLGCAVEQSYKELLIHHSKLWKKMLLFFPTSTLSINTYRIYSKLLVFSICNLIEKTSHFLRATGVLVRSNILSSLLTLIESNICNSLPHHLLVKLSLMDIAIFFLNSSVKLYEISLDQFKEGEGYEILRRLFLSILSINEEDNIQHTKHCEEWIFSQVKTIIFFTYWNHNQDILIESIDIDSLRSLKERLPNYMKFIDSKKKKSNSFTSRINSNVFQVLLIALGVLSKRPNNNSQIYTKILNFISEILINYKEEYYMELWRLNPFEVFSNVFSSLNQDMQTTVLDTFSIFMDMENFQGNTVIQASSMSKIRLQENLSHKLTRIGTDTYLYLSLLLNAESNVAKMICKHIIQRFTVQNTESLKALLRLSHFPKVINASLQKFKKRSSILELIIELISLYSKGNYLNHSSLLQRNGDFLNLVYHLMYRHLKLIKPILKLLQDFVILDRKQKWNITSDMIHILDSDRKSNQSLELDYGILIMLKISLVENRHAMSEFISKNGFQVLINHLHHLEEYTKNTEKSLLLKVVKSNLDLLKTLLDISLNNQHLFISQKNFQQMLTPFYKIEFLGEKNMKLSRSFCLTLLQLSFLSHGEFKANLDLPLQEIFSEYLNSYQFSLQIPEIITIILLDLTAHAVEKYNSYTIVIEIIETILLLASKSSNVMKKLCKSNFLTILLERFRKCFIEAEHPLHTIILKTFETFASHNISISELQMYFSMFSLPNIPEDVIISIIKVCSKEDILTPNDYIDFIPIRSGKSERPKIVLPAKGLSGWPSRTGNTFTMWVCVESIPKDSFLSLIDIKSNDLNMKLLVDSKGYILIELNQKYYDSSRDVVKFNYTIPFSKWIHLSLIHQTIYSNQEVSLCHEFNLHINSIFHIEKQTIQVKNNSIVEKIKEIFMKTSIHSVSLGSFKQKSGVYGSYQIGNVYLFEHILDLRNLYIHFCLGPNYAGYFKEPDISRLIPNSIIHPKAFEYFNLPELVSFRYTKGLDSLNSKIVFIFSSRDVSIISRKNQTFIKNAKLNIPSIENYEDIEEVVPTLTFVASFDSGEFITPSTSQNSFTSPISPQSLVSAISNKSRSTKSDSHSISYQSIFPITYGPTYSQDSNSKVYSHISISSSELIPIRSKIHGPIESTNRVTLKTSLENVGGLKIIIAMLGIPSIQSRFPYLIIYLISQLLRGSSNNLDSMIELEGYNILKYVLQKDGMKVDIHMLMAIWDLCGFDIFTKLYVNKEYGSLDELISNSTSTSPANEFPLFKDQILTDFIAFDKLILNYKIWKKSSLSVQSFLYETVLSFLTNHTYSNFFQFSYDTLSVHKRLLNSMEQCFLLDQYWPSEIISPVIEIIRQLIPTQASADKTVFPLCKHILSTHPKTDSFSVEMPQDARNAILQLILDIIETTPTIMEDLNTDDFLPISTLVIMTKNSNPQSRFLLLKIISLYLTYFPVAIRNEFSRQGQVSTLAAQLKQFDVQLEELQIFFNLFFENNNSVIKKPKVSLKQTFFSRVIPISSKIEDDTLYFEESKLISDSTQSLDSTIIDNPTPRRGRAYSIISPNRIQNQFNINSNFDEIFIPKDFDQLDNFYISDMLLGILTLIPSISNSVKRLNVLKTLLFVFMEGKPKIKETFFKWKLHTFLIKYISPKLSSGDYHFIECVISFFIEYLWYALYDQKFVVYSDSLTYFNVVEGGDENFVFSMQTKIIHSLLKRFKEKIYMNDEGATDMPFAEFCRISVEHLVRFENNRFITNNSLDSNINKVDENSKLLVKAWYYEELETMKNLPSNLEKNLEDFNLNSTLFDESLENTTSLHFWILDIIYRWIDIKHSKYGATDIYHQSTPEFLIARTLLKFLIFLMQSNSNNNIIYSLLSLLYVKTRGGSSRSLILEVTDQQVTTKQIILFIIESLSRKDHFINHLAITILKILISTQKSYIVNMFSIQISNFFEHLEDIIGLEGDSYLEKILKKKIISSIRDSLRQDLHKTNNNITDRIKSIAKEEREQNELMIQATSRQQTISFSLLSRQSEFKKVLLNDMRKDDRIILMNDAQWKQIVKELLLSECTLINAYESLNHRQHYSLLQLRKYTGNSYSTAEYKLDFTSGPERVCIRLKYRPRYLLENYYPSVTNETIINDDTDDSSRDDSQISSKSISMFRFVDESMLQMNPIQCSRITPLKKYSGELFLMEKHIYFFPKLNNDDSSIPKSLCMEYELIREIHFRRYMYKNRGIEIFMSNGRSCFLAFESEQERDDIYNILVKANRIPDHVDYSKLNKGSLFQNGITERWVNGEVSNFEYLLHINIMAGRSFNDLTQYPVFPWILADYDSEELDLTNPKTFRDLRKPMGALSENRMLKAIEKFQNLKENPDQNKPPFHWGTHYSTPTAVAYYLIRLEPYTKCMYNINDEKLDVPGRTFHSIQQSYFLSSGLSGSQSDVKELIPEFFFLPEFLENRNRIAFGTLENGNDIGDMILPPWAHNSSIEFIRKHRDALESEYVSQNLHHWINLIFGHKQRGEKAVEAVNIFYHFTYEDCTQNIELIDSDTDRNAAYEHIRHYGQTPHQLFKKPHPARKVTKPKENSVWAEMHIRERKHEIDKTTITQEINSQVSPSLQSVSSLHSSEVASPYSVQSIQSKQSYQVVSTKDKSRRPQLFFKRPYNEPIGDFRIISKDTNVICVGRNRVLLPPIEKSDDLKSKYNEKDDESGMRVISYDTNSDRSIHIMIHSTGKIESSIHSPLRASKYICHQLSKDGQLLALGTDQGSIALFKLNKKRMFQGNPTLLCGHSKRINCIDISHQYSICISASEDKSCIVWDLNKNKYMYAIRHQNPIDLCAINNLNGDIVVSERRNRVVYLYSINGTLIRKKHGFKHDVTSLFFVTDKSIDSQTQSIIFGMSNGDIIICDAATLITLQHLKTSQQIHKPIEKISVSKSAPNYIAACFNDGRYGRIVTVEL